MNFLLGGSIFRGFVKFREGKLSHFLLEPLSFPPTLLVNECGNGCPPQQELKQISNFQLAVFVFYTNINPVSLPLILEESQLHPVIIRYIYMKLIHCIPVPLSSSI